MNNKNLGHSQLALDFPHRPSLNREDFMIADCNREAAVLVDSWPLWPYFAVCIYGPEGCGKTHLANVFANKVANLTNFPYRIPCVKASALTADNYHPLFETNKCLIIEELQNLRNQEALFHLYNLYRDEGGNILFTSSAAPARLGFSLPDLRSRMNIVPAVEIKEPDDEILSALLLKLFTDRQILPAPELLEFILKNMQRSFAYARKLVAEIDNISLARKRAVTTAIAREAINSLSQDSQGDLFGSI